ncbi:MAG: bifunctional phosphopantothenoylcysteine decarboxylase/phosphopantothenate--cysteine ligase CoaBC [Breznakibacter sp.]|nr:bifunctional phosphopantothenoylcysteine decarboxylase/phosphopantothenate--cysteine ligase CoaBC [Breznakibacter sp.]
MLKGKKVILGVTGSIAAYKSALLLRLLVKEGAEVQVLMSAAGKEFITPVTMSALSGRPVLGEFFNTGDGTWHSHVDLGLWADVMIIAPASANTMGKMVNGICDNLLITTYLSAKCPVFVAPAMDLDMYLHPSTQANLEKLISYGNKIIEPGSGELASGLYGKGRMEEPAVIVECIKYFFADIIRQELPNLIKRKVLVTAGPTYEHIDPVRFIGNHSSGKMGYAIAECLAEFGAEVTLVSGPVTITTEHPRISVVKVTSAKEMYDAVMANFEKMDAAISCAAVADYRPKTVSSSKIKRVESELNIELEATADIAAELGRRKAAHQLLVGFALETNNGAANAKAKLEKKNLDFIVLNSLEDSGAGFGVDTNKITIIDRNNKIEEYPLKSKLEVAKDIVVKLSELLP